MFLVFLDTALSRAKHVTTLGSVLFGSLWASRPRAQSFGVLLWMVRASLNLIILNQFGVSFSNLVYPLSVS